MSEQIKYYGDVYLQGTFEVNAAKPIDNRVVVDKFNDLNNIPNKYDGLLVSCLEDNTLYIYNNSNWVSSGIQITTDLGLINKPVNGQIVSNSQDGNIYIYKNGNWIASGIQSVTTQADLQNLQASQGQLVSTISDGKLNMRLEDEWVNVGNQIQVISRSDYATMVENKTVDSNVFYYIYDTQQDNYELPNYTTQKDYDNLADKITEIRSQIQEMQNIVNGLEARPVLDFGKLDILKLL